MRLFDRLVWWHVYQEGGWHSREEIGDDLGLSARERMRLRHTLYRLARDGYLRRAQTRQGIRCMA